MNYEKGLAKLQEQLEKANDEEASKLVLSLAKKLCAYTNDTADSNDSYLSPEIKSIVDDLNSIAYRNIGMSFVDMCDESKSVFSKRLFPLSLSSILVSILVVLILPGLGVVSISLANQTILQQQIERVREEVRMIDTRIDEEIASYFYLSWVNPCSKNIEQEVIITTTTLNLKIETDGENRMKNDETPTLCIWQYEDISHISTEIIAEDYWGLTNELEIQNYKFTQPKYQLSKRKYKKTEDITVIDFFNWQDNDCFKRRKYLMGENNLLVEECYTEAGERRILEDQETSISPIPPMVYWFFYR